MWQGPTYQCDRDSLIKFQGSTSHVTRTHLSLMGTPYYVIGTHLSSFRDPLIMWQGPTYHCDRDPLIMWQGLTHQVSGTHLSLTGTPYYVTGTHLSSFRDPLIMWQGPPYFVTDSLIKFQGPTYHVTGTHLSCDRDPLFCKADDLHLETSPLHWNSPSECFMKSAKAKVWFLPRWNLKLLQRWRKPVNGFGDCAEKIVTPLE